VDTVSLDQVVLLVALQSADERERNQRLESLKKSLSSASFVPQHQKILMIF